MKTRQMEFQIPNPVNGYNMMCCDQITLDHCGPSSWDNVTGSTDHRVVMKEQLKGLLLAELQKLAERQAKLAIDCLRLTSDAIDQAYARYWDQKPQPEPLERRSFVLTDNRRRPWTLEHSPTPAR